MALEAKATYFSKTDSPERPRRNGDLRKTQDGIEDLEDQGPAGTISLTQNNIYAEVNPYLKRFKVSPYPAEREEIIGGHPSTHPDIDKRFLPLHLGRTGRLAETLEQIATVKGIVKTVLDQESETLSQYDQNLLTYVEEFASNDRVEQTRAMLLDAAVRNLGKERQKTVKRHFKESLTKAILAGEKTLLIPAENEDTSNNFGGEILDHSQWGDIRTAWINRVIEMAKVELFNEGVAAPNLSIKHRFFTNGDLGFTINSSQQKPE